LVAYFFLRAASLLASSGTLGLLATNTIAQGDTRDVGLDQLARSGITIHRAVRSRPWPGGESLEVSEVWASRGSWSGETWLDNVLVRGVTTALTPLTRVVGAPFALNANMKQSFQGSIVLGMGFTMSAEEAAGLIERDARNAEVLFPYLGGAELNDSPTHTPPRWVINFFDWDEERARSYPDCYEIVDAKVRPERARLLEKGYATAVRRGTYWWQYAADAKSLYAAIEGLERAIAIARVSKTLMPAFIGAKQVCSDQVVVFPYEDEFHLGVLCSAFHWWWALTRSSTMRTDTRYTPTDCFETFPQPVYSAVVEREGRALNEHRRELMITVNEGLTKTYNRLHNSGDSTPGIVRLRDLHVALDDAVRDAYGWGDLELDHDFHPTDQGIRFTLGPSVRVEVLDRLLEENHRRHAAEIASGLASDDGKKKARRKRTSSAPTRLF
jgi:hypothetical protein